MPAGSYHLIHGLEKGLAVLRALNRAGPSSASSLATTTGLPRPTVHRILETLAAAGYVDRGDTRGVFRLTPVVRLLSDGYHDDDVIADIARPIMSTLCDQIVWPTDIVSYYDGTMLVRATTHPRSPLSVHRAIVGTRFPLLTSASGQIYLAFCSGAERREIIGLLERRRGSDAAKLRNGFDVGAMVRTTRRLGYAVVNHRAPSRTSSLAVPIYNRKILACLVAVWITSALPDDEAIRRLVPPLRKAAAVIAKESRGRLGAATPDRNLISHDR